MQPSAPDFGRGPKTAVIAATMLWAVMVIFALLLVAMGLRTVASYAKSSVLHLLSAVASCLVGAALYRE